MSPFIQQIIIIVVVVVVVVVIIYRVPAPIIVTKMNKIAIPTLLEFRA